MSTILITGFDPFGKDTVNTSWECVKALPDTVNGWKLVKRQLPTVYGRAAETALEAAAECEASLILLVGQAASRPVVTVEQMAVNTDDCSIPDNDGVLLRDVRIDPEGEAARFSTLLSSDIIAQMNSEGINGICCSWSAGTFVCNDTLYRVLKSAAAKTTFIHVPLFTDALPQTEIQRILTRFIELAVSRFDA